MPLILPIETLPVQEIQYTYSGVRFIITIRQLDASIVTFSVSRDGGVIISDTRAVPNSPLIPFSYLDEGLGNFYFETPNGELPNYENFGSTHLLLFVTPEELADARS